MGKIILFLILATLSLKNPLLAEEKINWQEVIIGSSFKSLAKAFVAVVDIKKLKQDNIDKLKKKNEEKFRKQYVKVYVFIKDLPAALKDSYGVSENMSKEQAIKNIESLDKQRIYQIIDSIPDKTITAIFKRYLAEKKQQFRESDLVGQIKRIWNKILEGARKK